MKGNICQFVQLNSNFKAEEYFDRIYCNNPLEPPAIMKLSDEDITNMIKNGSQQALPLPDKIMCHANVSIHFKLYTWVAYHNKI